MILSIPYGWITSLKLVDAAQAGVNSRVSQAKDSDEVFKYCQIFGLTPAATIKNEPVVSDFPGLILKGEHDPVSFPANGYSTAAYRSHFQYLEFPGVAHDVLSFSDSDSKCYTGLIVVAFFKDPTAPVDDGCMADIPPLFGYSRE